jgi:hypothetical protein
MQHEERDTAEIVKISDDELQKVFSFLTFKELFYTLPLVNKHFKNLLSIEYPYWKFIYEDPLMRQSLGIPVRKLKQYPNDKTDYRELFLTRIPQLIYQRKVLFEKLDDIRVKGEVPLVVYKKIIDLVAKSLKLVIGFEGTQLNAYDSTTSPPFGKSRFRTRTFDVPADKSVSSDDVVLQLDMSLLKDTFYAEEYNLPTHGMLYFTCPNRQPALTYYDRNNLVRTGSNPQNLLVCFDENFIIDRAVEILDFQAMEDVPELNTLLRMSDMQEFYDIYGYSEEDVEGWYFGSMCDDFRNTVFCFSKDNSRVCSLQMFGSPYYLQHHSMQYSSDLVLLFQYYAEYGGSLHNILINKDKMINRDYTAALELYAQY